MLLHMAAQFSYCLQLLVGQMWHSLQEALEKELLLLQAFCPCAENFQEQTCTFVSFMRVKCQTVASASSGTSWYSMGPGWLFSLPSGTVQVLDDSLAYHLAQYRSWMTLSYHPAQWHSMGHRWVFLTVCHSGTTWVLDWCFLQSGTVAQLMSWMPVSYHLAQ